MASVISVIQKSGIGYSATNVGKAEFYFLSIDSNVEEPIDYPITIPDAGTVYSYEIWLRFRCDVAPSSYCNNFKIWVTGALGTGQNITVNTDNIVTYVSPVNSESSQGTRGDLIDYNAGNKLSVAGTLNDIADKSNFMVMQLEVQSSASNGSISDWVVNYQYDEV